MVVVENNLRSDQSDGFFYCFQAFKFQIGIQIFFGPKEFIV